MAIFHHQKPYRYKAAGFSHLLGKPFDNAALREALHVAQRVAVAAAGSGVSGLPRHLNIVRESSGF